MTATNERIGRVDENVTFEKVTNHPGGRLSVDGKFAVGAGNEERLYTARDLLLAHVGNEFEPVIPFVSTVHPRWSGYYLLDDVQVDMGKGALDGLVEWPFSLELIPVTTKQRPLVESILWGGPRQGRSADDGSWWSIPSSARSIYTGFDGSQLNSPTPTVIDGPGGEAWLFYHTDTDTDNVLYNTRASYVLRPENWYDMACTLQVGGQIVVGRQTLDAPTDWVVDNGLIRFESGTDSLIRLVLPNGWTGATAWNETIDVQVGVDTGGGTWYEIDPDDVLALFPVRICNEEISFGLRCEMNINYAVPGAPDVATVYVSLRRGARFATVTVATPGTTQAPAVWLDGNPAGTAIGTGSDERGFYRTSATTDGLLIVFAQSEAGGNVDTDQANSRVYTTSPQPMFEVGVGFAHAGASSSPDQYDDMVTMWCAAMSETASVRRGG